MQWKGVSVGAIQSLVDKYLREQLICDDISYDICFTELLKPSKSDLDDDQIVRQLQEDSLEKRLSLNNFKTGDNTILVSIEGYLSVTKVSKLKKENKCIPLLPISCDKSMISKGLLESFLVSGMSGCEQNNLDDIPLKSQRDYIGIFIKQQRSCNSFISSKSD